MEIVKNKKKLATMVHYMREAHNYYWQPSNFLTGYMFWNAAEKEFGTSFPTIYTTNELFEEIVVGKKKTMVQSKQTT